MTGLSGQALVAVCALVSMALVELQQQQRYSVLINKIPPRYHWVLPVAASVSGAMADSLGSGQSLSSALSAAVAALFVALPIGKAPTRWGGATQ